MTTTTNKYSYIDINADGSQTIKGILEIELANKRKLICVYRIRPASKIVLLSALIGSTMSGIHLHAAEVANHMLIKVLYPTELKPEQIIWIENDGDFTGDYDGVDIRAPFAAKRVNSYYSLLLDWNGSEFHATLPARKIRERINDEHQLSILTSDIFGKVSDVTTKLNWKKNTYCLDREHQLTQVNPDGSITIKAIYHWEHPFYPGNCLLRILLTEIKAIIMITELDSSIPPEAELGHCLVANSFINNMVQVVNGIYSKYNSQFTKYSIDNLFWVYDRCGRYAADRSYGWSKYYSSGFSLILLKWSQCKFEPQHPKNLNIYGHNYVTIQQRKPIECFISDLFGSVDESLTELGWGID